MGPPVSIQNSQSVVYSSQQSLQAYIGQTYPDGQLYVQQAPVAMGLVTADPSTAIPVQSIGQGLGMFQ